MARSAREKTGGHESSAATAHVKPGDRRLGKTSGALTRAAEGGILKRIQKVLENGSERICINTSWNLGNVSHLAYLHKSKPRTNLLLQQEVVWLGSFKRCLRRTGQSGFVGGSGKRWFGIYEAEPPVFSSPFGIPDRQHRQEPAPASAPKPPA